MRSPSLRARAGFTLPETILSMTLMLILIGLSTQLFRNQSGSVSKQSGVLDAQSNSRFALSMLDRELRVAGIGVADAQPLIVEAGPTSITFNADLVALDTGDLNAVYVNPDADSTTTDAMRKANQLTIPGTSVMYPDTDYVENGTPSLAETISYWLSHDSTSTAANEYILFRRVNASTPRVVARGIIYNGAADTVFSYFKTDSSGQLRPVSMALLPIVHTAAIHGSALDSGRSALTDSIKEVRVKFKSVYHDPRQSGTAALVYRETDATIHLMNAGLIKQSQCGNPPIAVPTPTAVVTPASAPTVPQTYVTITWTASTDEASGEKDIQRYALYRRLSSASTFDQPFTSVAPGSTTYSFRDTDVLTGQSWIYGVAAQDCTPTTSAIAASSTVVIP